MQKAYQTCLEIFEQRGYDIIEKDEDQILSMKKNGKQICAFMANTPKFNVERIQEYLTIMKQIDVWHAIIVYKDNATPVAKKVIEDANDLIIELFHEDELQYNITKHYLVPKHELAYSKGTKGAKEFKEKYGDTFPIILRTDPVSRFYGYNKGDIIKITRKGNYVTYRFVK
jgi:DNA-directed RNA polymerase I, II, and III subunit RPABC1